MHLKTLSPVADPGFAKVTNGSNHSHSGGKDSRMFDQTIAGLQHALDFATLGTNGQSLDTLTEVTKGSGLLLPGLYRVYNFSESVDNVKFTQIYF